MNTTTKDKERVGKITMAIVGHPGKRPVGKTALLVECIRQLIDHDHLEIIRTVRNEIVHGSADIPADATDFVVLTIDDYARLVEDAEDRAATEAYHRTANEERVPAAVVDRLLAGESPIRVWREHRGMTLDQLGAAAGLSKGYLSDLENGKRAGPVETLQAIARALGIGLDELAPGKNRA